jgi:uncharacterized protein
MALICDTSGIYALYDADDRNHIATRRVIESTPGPFFVCSALLSEIDYLLAAHLGPSSSLDFFDSILNGAFRLESLTLDDVQRSHDLMRQYASLKLGFADAAVIATAERLRIQDVLTSDLRHFRVVRPRHWPALRLMPSDA